MTGWTLRATCIKEIIARRRSTWISIGRADGQRFATRVDGDLYYTLSDHLGSTSLVVDAQGNEAYPECNRRVGHVIYDALRRCSGQAYGQIVTNTIPLTLTDRLFTGQGFDASTGLYYHNARY
jgi:hypothetical protein